VLERVTGHDHASNAFRLLVNHDRL
jgi:hypothetical protein